MAKQYLFQYFLTLLILLAFIHQFSDHVCTTMQMGLLNIFNGLTSRISSQMVFGKIKESSGCPEKLFGWLETVVKQV